MDHRNSSVCSALFRRTCSYVLSIIQFAKRACRRENLILLHANNKGADQTARMRSLVSAFVVRSFEGVTSKLSTCQILKSQSNVRNFHFLPELQFFLSRLLLLESWDFDTECENIIFYLSLFMIQMYALASNRNRIFHLRIIHFFQRESNKLQTY